jgi:hemerythrin superfamily protein
MSREHAQQLSNLHTVGALKECLLTDAILVVRRRIRENIPYISDRSDCSQLSHHTHSLSLSLPLPLTPFSHSMLQDHRNTLTLLTQFFKIAENNIQAASLIAIALVIDLRLHQHAEFEVLYPLLQQVDKESGSLLVKHNLQEHKNLDSQLEELLDVVSSSPDTNSSRLVSLVQRIEELFIAHQAEEELQVLPRLAKGLSTKELVEAGAQFTAAKQHADLKLA